jgi:hypothetical protein
MQGGIEKKMGRTTHHAIALLLVPVLISGSRVNAQAHGPAAADFIEGPEADSPTIGPAKLAEMDAWLRRMTGRFRLSSATNSERPGVLVDCIGVGAGPGVQCMTGRGGNTPEGEPANASMQLFGLDPLTRTISRLTVNGRGIAQHAQGKLAGDTLVFPRTNCPVPENIRNEMDMISCVEILKIRARASGEELQFITEMILYRMPPAPPPGLPRTTGSQPTILTSTMWMKRVQREEDLDAQK